MRKTQVRQERKVWKLPGYQDYFEGYTEVKVPKKNGKGFRVERIYTADYHCHDMTRDRWILQKVMFGILTIACIALFLWAAFDPIDSNHAKNVVLPCGLGAVTVLFLTVSSIRYIAQPQLMTIYQCNEAKKQLRIWSLLASICLVLTGLMTLAYLIDVSFQDIWETIFCMFRYLLAASAAGVIYWIESKTQYCEAANDTQIPFYPDMLF